MKITMRNTAATFHRIQSPGLYSLITLEDYDQQYDLLTLNVSVSQLEAPDRKMALTVRLTEDGYQYLSYLPR